MKKALSLLLALVMCLSLCACGGKNENDSGTNAKATIVTNEGITVEMSALELFAEFDSNEARFLKLYGGASIEFIGTVKSIKVETTVPNGNSHTPNQNKIVFEEGWSLIIGNWNTTYDLANYYPGQKLKVCTGIVCAEVADNDKVVWLAGNDKLYSGGGFINKQTTTISNVE